MRHSGAEGMSKTRFAKTDRDFFSGLEIISHMNIPVADYIHQFPLFTGHVNLARYLALYEAFKMVQGLSGHYADVGTWKGASFVFIAKLIKLFEPYSYAQIHAFDWFKGVDPAKRCRS